MDAGVEVLSGRGEVDVVGVDGIPEDDVVSRPLEGTLDLDISQDGGHPLESEDAVDVELGRGGLRRPEGGPVLVHVSDGQIPVRRHVGAAKPDFPIQTDSAPGPEESTGGGTGLIGQIDGIGGVDGIAPHLRIRRELVEIDELRLRRGTQTE